MNELHYQLDLLKAMNQKLTNRDRMYKLICETVSGAFLYYSFERDELITLGKWDQFFDFEITNLKDIDKLFESMDDKFIFLLRDAFYIEKQNGENAAVDCRLRNSKIWIHFDIRVVYDEAGRPTDKILSIENITKYKSQNEELTYMAYYDSVTGLLNRNYFVRQLGGLVERAAREHNIVSVLNIDIDDFRKVNDGLGIVIGDELVQQFGSFLNEFSEENVIVGHFSSDVYCMAIYDPVGNRSVEQIHKTILQRTKKPFHLSGGQELQITVSVGVAEYPEAAQSSLELINCAEIVMFKGKAMGKNRIQYFDANILDDFLHSVEIDSKLKEAVFNKNFELYYQPQYYSGNKRLRGMEALIRWRDETGNMISPSVFIPIAEKNGTIVSIGNWVVEQSVKQYAKWRESYGASFVMSINISALQYHREDFVNEIIEILRKYHMDPSKLELEITESVLIDDFDAVYEKLRLLKEYGIRISLDDFGTGFSSLSYLKKLPIDTLKIDKSFIDTVLTDSATRIIMESIIDMVKALGFESIAEGVEEEQQYKYLHAIGCDVIQGFLFGKPQAPEQLNELLQKMI